MEVKNKKQAKNIVGVVLPCYFVGGNIKWEKN